jgi:hypothetical protein
MGCEPSGPARPFSRLHPGGPLRCPEQSAMGKTVILRLELSRDPHQGVVFRPLGPEGGEGVAACRIGDIGDED